MDDTEFRQHLADLRALIPPKKGKSEPIFKAQAALHDAAHGRYVEISNQVYSFIPGFLLVFHVKDRVIRKSRIQIKLRSTPEAVRAVHWWLWQGGWRPPTATCRPTRRGKGKTEKKRGGS